MSERSARELAEQWYAALAAGDLAAFQAIHATDCVYNISGHTPISGQVGFADLMQNVVPVVFGALNMEAFEFGKRRAIVCADEKRAVGIMEADGPGRNGIRYDQRYVHIFEAASGQLTKVWEFFDTALANTVMFTDPGQVVPGVDATQFEIS